MIDRSSPDLVVSPIGTMPDPEHLDMTNYGISCDTARCMAGIAVLMPVFQEAGLSRPRRSAPHPDKSSSAFPDNRRKQGRKLHRQRCLREAGSNHSNADEDSPNGGDNARSHPILHAARGYHDQRED